MSSGDKEIPPQDPVRSPEDNEPAGIEFRCTYTTLRYRPPRAGDHLDPTVPCVGRLAPVGSPDVSTSVTSEQSCFERSYSINMLVKTLANQGY